MPPEVGAYVPLRKVGEMAAEKMPAGPALTDDQDHALVSEALGRAPEVEYRVVVRGDDGVPWVIRNAPFTRSGVPMPTRFWLLPTCPESAAIGRLESSGGVRAAEAAVDPAELAAAHDRHRAVRDVEIARYFSDHGLLDASQPRPTGGVAGTRRGVKCLHAHYAAYLAGEDDPVGAWVRVQVGVPWHPDEHRHDTSGGSDA